MIITEKYEIDLPYREYDSSEQYAILNKEEVKSILKFLEKEWLDRHNELGLEVVRKLEEFVKED